MLISRSCSCSLIVVSVLLMDVADHGRPFLESEKGSYGCVLQYGDDLNTLYFALRNAINLEVLLL